MARKVHTIKGVDYHVNANGSLKKLTYEIISKIKEYLGDEKVCKHY